MYGKYFDSSNVRKRLTRIIDKINTSEEEQNKKISHRKFHDLRHTYATRLFELGEEPCHKNHRKNWIDTVDSPWLLSFPDSTHSLYSAQFLSLSYGKK